MSLDDLWTERMTMTNDLIPSIENLKEEYVLVQAWKKTSNHIRTHNWFSDTLELDLAAINLKKFISDLVLELEEIDNWRPVPLRLVPAPKSKSCATSNGRRMND